VKDGALERRELRDDPREPLVVECSRCGASGERPNAGTAVEIAAVSHLEEEDSRLVVGKWTALREGEPIARRQ
jgi:hypothetical protein